MLACSAGDDSKGDDPLPGDTSIGDVEGKDLGVDGTNPDVPPPCAEPGKVSCDGTCVDLQKDPNNCGSCSNKCGAATLCCSGACVETATCDFSVTKLSPFEIWQSGNDWVTVTGNGFVSGMKLYIGDGRAALRVIDATHAMIQTPPGPPGKRDVRITSGGSTATLKEGVQYVSGLLSPPWQTKPLSIVRGEFPGVAVMQDGRVLIAGGATIPDNEGSSTDTAEIFNRTTETVTPAANKMSATRWRNLAVTLLTGKVLVAGKGCGFGTSCVGTAADLFDPSTNKFTPTKGNLIADHDFTRGVLMADGRVFIMSESLYGPLAATVDIYDPVSDSFKSYTPPAAAAGNCTRLRDGRILVGGGGGTYPGMLFDPDTTTFTTVGSMSVPRGQYTMHTLPDGRAIVIGDRWAPTVATMEVYDPKTKAFTVLPYTLTAARGWHASALVRDGTIIVLGGYTGGAGCTPTDTVDVVDPVKGTVKPFAKLLKPNCELNAVTLLDGSILGIGGGACGTTTALPDLVFLPGAPGVIK